MLAQSKVVEVKVELGCERLRTQDFQRAHQLNAGTWRNGEGHVLLQTEAAIPTSAGSRADDAYGVPGWIVQLKANFMRADSQAGQLAINVFDKGARLIGLIIKGKQCRCAQANGMHD